MKRTLWYDALFFLSVFVFVCLLLTGGPRLIAVPEEDDLLIRPEASWLEASFTCLPSANHEGFCVRHQSVRKISVCTTVFRVREPDRLPLLVTDANGNILRHLCYMRTVYQAFTLGDGFA